MSISATIYLSLLAILPFLNGGRSPLADFLIYIAPLLVVISLLPRRRQLHLTKVQAWLGATSLISTAILVFSTYYSVSVIESIYDLFRSLSFYLLIFLGFWALKGALTYISVLVATIGTILSAVSFYYLLPGVQPPTSDFTLYYATYGHNHLSAYLLISLPVTLGLFSKYVKSKKIISVSIAIQLIAFLLTFSRSAWIILLITTTFLLFNTKAGYHRKNKILLILTAVSLVAFLTFSFWRTLKYSDNTTVPPAVLSRIITKPLNLHPRLVYFKDSYLKTIQRPLTGWGPDTFTYSPPDRMSRNVQTSFAHNYFLQIAYETGFVHLVLVLIFISTLYLVSIKHIHSYLEKSVFIGAIMSLLLAQVDFDWHSPAVYLTAIIPLVIIISSRDLPKINSRYVCLAVFLLSLFPIIFLLIAAKSQMFNRSHYQELITKNDKQQNYFQSEKLLDQWYQLDYGNSQMYDFRAERQIKLGNYQHSLQEFLHAYTASFNSSSLNLGIANQLVDHVLNRNSQLEPTDTLALIETIARSYQPHDFFHYKPWQYSVKIGRIVDLLLEVKPSEFSDQQIAALNYWKYTFLIWSDQRDFAEYQQYIDRASELTPTNSHYSLLAQTNNKLISSNQKDLTEQIGLIQGNSYGYFEQPKIYTLILTYLYQSLADSYQRLADFDQEVKTRQLAIDLQDNLSSSYLDAAIRLHQLGQISQSQAIIEQCVQRVSSDCRNWFAYELENSINH